MKRLLATFIFLFTAILWAADPQGVFANVELISGTKQKAQFLGIENDTVQLGGYIKNNFTIVRIAKKQFKSIVDENGNDLLNPKPQQKDSIPEKTDIPADSLASTSNDSTNASVESPTSKDSFLKDLRENNVNAVFFNFKSNGLPLSKEKEESFLANLSNFIFATLKQNSPSGVTADAKIFDDSCDDNICIQTILHQNGVQKIYWGNVSKTAHKDSVSLELTYVLFEDSLPTVYRAEENISLNNFVDDMLSNNKMKFFMARAEGDTTKQEKSLKSYIHVETDPEGASISLAAEYDICKSPCTFAVEDTNKVTLNAYWNVDQHLWGAQATIRPLPGDTAKISLQLKRVNPELKILTAPGGAEIFSGSEEINKRSKAIGKTPNSYPIVEPGMVHFKLRKAGFRDSLVSVYVPPTAGTTINIEMERITDYEELKAQETWQKERTNLFIGKTLMGVSIAPILVGAIFSYLAFLDYDDADTIKKDLESAPSANGANYQAKVDENRDLVKDGDKKLVIGGSLIGSGIALFGLGLFFSF